MDDIAGVRRRLDDLGIRWVAAIEYRGEGGAWFGTFEDPDGNHVQLIQLTPSYCQQRRTRHGESPLGRSALADATLGARLPAQDLDRAQAFYAERLGLYPAEARDGGLRYECGDTYFAIFRSAGRPSGQHTQLGFQVEDIEATVKELRERGLVFDDVTIDGLLSGDGIVDIPGHYPSSGAVGERAVWFHDSEGNLIGVSQLVMPTNA